MTLAPRDPGMATTLDKRVNAESGATGTEVLHQDEINLQKLVSSLHEVQLNTAQAITEMSRRLHEDITVGMIRQAAALGDTRAKSQAEALYSRGYGGGYDVMAGLESPNAGQTSSTDGSLAGGSTVQGGGAGAGPQDAVKSHPTTMQQLQVRATQRVGQQVQDFFSPGKHAAKVSLGRRAGMGVGRSIAQSGGTMEGFVNALKRESPLAAGGIIAAEQAQKMYGWGLEQTEAGRAYERVEGPMDTVQQQMERARSQIWRFRSLGESGQESEAQFRAATQLGLRGGARSYALQQMYRQTTRIGMDPEQEAEVLKIAVQNAGVSLSNLTDSLSSVSKAAQDAHVNADTARDSFIKMMQTTLAQGFGPSAGALSQAATTMMTSMGPQMQGADASGMFSQGRMLALAGQSGMNPMQFAASNINDQGATFALASDRFTDQALQGVLGAAWPLVQQTAQQNASAIMQDSNLAGTLAQRVISNPIFNQSVASPQALMGVVAQLGGIQTTDIVQCVTWILQHLAGKTTAGALAAQVGQTQTMSNAAANRQRGTNPNLLSSGQMGAKLATDTVSSLSNEFAGAGSSLGAARRALGGGVTNLAGDARALGDLDVALVKGAGGVVGTAEHVLNPWYHGEKGAHTLGAIRKEEKRTGQTSPVIEAVYQKIRASGMNPDNTMVEIQTSSGPIEVAFSEAVKNYPDSIASGQFVIKGHRYKDSFAGVHYGAYKYRGDDQLSGKSLAQLGITADTSQGVTAGATAEQAKATPKGDKTAAQVHYQGGSKGMAQMFDLTPQAAAILTPLVQGSQSQGALAASQGSPPPVSTDASNPARLVGH